MKETHFFFFFWLDKGIKMRLSISRFCRNFVNEGFEASNGFEWKRFTFEINVNVTMLISLFPILPWITWSNSFTLRCIFIRRWILHTRELGTYSLSTSSHTVSNNTKVIIWFSVYIHPLPAESIYSVVWISSARDFFVSVKIANVGKIWPFMWVIWP